MKKVKSVVVIAAMIISMLVLAGCGKKEQNPSVDNENKQGSEVKQENENKQNADSKQENENKQDEGKTPDTDTTPVNNAEDKLIQVATPLPKAEVYKEFDLRSAVTLAEGSTVTAEGVYFDSRGNEKQLEINDLKFTCPTVDTTCEISISVAKGDKNEKADFKIEIIGNPERAEVGYKNLWSDNGVTKTVQYNPEFIKDGNSSLKVSYNGYNVFQYGVNYCTLDGRLSTKEGGAYDNEIYSIYQEPDVDKAFENAIFYFWCYNANKPSDTQDMSIYFNVAMSNHDDESSFNKETGRWDLVVDWDKNNLVECKPGEWTLVPISLRYYGKTTNFYFDYETYYRSGISDVEYRNATECFNIKVQGGNAPANESERYNFTFYMDGQNLVSYDQFKALFPNYEINTELSGFKTFVPTTEPGITEPVKELSEIERNDLINEPTANFANRNGGEAPWDGWTTTLAIDTSVSAPDSDQSMRITIEPTQNEKGLIDTTVYAGWPNWDGSVWSTIDFGLYGIANIFDYNYLEFDIKVDNAQPWVSARFVGADSMSPEVGGDFVASYPNITFDEYGDGWYHVVYDFANEYNYALLMDESTELTEDQVKTYNALKAAKQLRLCVSNSASDQKKPSVIYVDNLRLGNKKNEGQQEATDVFNNQASFANRNGGEAPWDGWATTVVADNTVKTANSDQSMKITIEPTQNESGLIDTKEYAGWPGWDGSVWSTVDFGLNGSVNVFEYKKFEFNIKTENAQPWVSARFVGADSMSPEVGGDFAGSYPNITFTELGDGWYRVSYNFEEEYNYALLLDEATELTEDQVKTYNALKAAKQLRLCVSNSASDQKKPSVIYVDSLALVK